MVIGVNNLDISHPFSYTSIIKKRNKSRNLMNESENNGIMIKIMNYRGDKRMKRIFAFALCFVFLSTCLMGCAPKKNNNSHEDGNIIKIGAVFPLSGGVATFGISSQNAINLAVKEWNDKGGIDGKQIKIIYKDDENKPANSAKAVENLISEDNVVAVMGSASSKCSIAMGSIATANKVPMISPNSTSPKVTVDGGEYVFRACFLDLFQGTALAKFAVYNLNAQRAAILFDMGNDYSKGLAEFFQQDFENLGGEIVAFESYNTGDRDFTAQILKLKETKPDVILLADYYNPVGIIAKQAREKGISGTFLGGDGWDSSELYKIGGEAMNGSYFSNHYSVGEQTKVGNSFREKFVKTYNTQPDAFAALSYDASYILFSAIEKAGSLNGAKIKDSLKATDMEVVSGRILFDENRNPIKGAVIEKVLKDKMEFVTRIDP